MADRFDVAEAMRAGICDRDQAWDFIRAFAAEWTAPLRDGDGYDDAELREAEERLGFALPAALREAYLLFGRRADLTSNQDQLRPPLALGLTGGDVLVIRDENQSVTSWGIPMAAIADPDPPVVFEHGKGWRPFLDRVSLACVELVLTEVLCGPESLFNAAEIPAELISVVEANYRQVNFPEYPVWAEPEKPVRWFSAPGQLLRMDGRGPRTWLFVRGWTVEDLQRIYRAVPADWTLANALS